MACKKESVELDFCKMISEDQLYVNNDKSNMEKYNMDKIERHRLFKKNFNLIMLKTKQEGFPSISLSNAQADSCKFWAVSMTMIHTAQSEPNVFFSKKYVDVFKEEMDKGNLEKELLRRSSITTAMTIDLCEALKPNIKYATKTWDIDPKIFTEAKFITCANKN
jgi:hypothetical protein